MSHSVERISCGEEEEEDFRPAPDDFRDDELECDLDEELVVECLVVVEAVVVVVVVVLVEAGETEDGLVVFPVEGDARDEADCEELVWRLVGIALVMEREK